MLTTDRDFPTAIRRIRQLFFTSSHAVHTERWQGMNVAQRPEMESYELLNLCFSVPLNGQKQLAFYRTRIGPNLPWADDHFLERVCGAPINPGVEWKNWPWERSSERFLNHYGQFNHNYMERYWPKYAAQLNCPTRTAEDYHTAIGELDTVPPWRGLRGEYHDLEDLVELLAREPLTRQAWIPIFFPEDTGISNDMSPGGQRKPCTLGYQFIMRDSQLHVYYPLRSCDFVRHFRDDIYLTVRLLLWVLERCQELSKQWKDVVPGTFTMHCTSLHMFKNDWIDMFGRPR